MFVSARESSDPCPWTRCRPTARRPRLEANPRRSGRVMALSEEAIVTTRLDGIVISWSRGAERMYGFPADEMKGRSIHATIPAERSSELGSILDRVRTGGAVEDVATVAARKTAISSMCG